MADSDGSENNDFRDRFRRERTGDNPQPGNRRSNRFTPPNDNSKRPRRENDRPRQQPFSDEEVVYRTPLMPFKRFLDPLDDHINDSDALQKYQQYKEDFQRKQIEEFFENHKNEEWLRFKYHPDHLEATKETAQKFVLQRLDVFLDLFDKNFLDNVPVEIDQSDKISKLLDAVVIKLNGGSDDDLKILDHEPTPEGAEEVQIVDSTASIFFRNLPANVKREELEELCRTHDGFLRLAVWDPSPERRFTSYAWATYKSDVAIKKICWELNTSPLLREKYATPGAPEISVIVNREMKQRVRPVMPITRHREIMKKDLLLAAKLINRLDAKMGLWTKEITFDLPEGIVTANPLMRNLDSFLGEEPQKDEKASPGEGGVDEDTVALENDASLAQCLDRLILYLRIVHSFDFYSVTKYPQEDLMPHKCGIMHARGDRGVVVNSPPETTSGLTFTRQEIDDYVRNFARRLEPFIEQQSGEALTEEEMQKLGMRDPEKAEQDFIQANVQKRISKKKPFKVVYVCPLSDKKFREPVFVEKHILNKHLDKVQAARKDRAEFFNNYLRDPQRPSLPDAPRHVIDRFYPPRRGGMGSHPSGGGGQHSNYSRGRFGSNNRGRFGSGNRFGGHQDFAQQQAMAALASAAAALCQSGGTSNPGEVDGKSIANILTGAVASVGRQHSGGNRPYYGGRGAPGGLRQNPMPDRSQRRGMVAYNDLDDPQNENF